MPPTPISCSRTLASSSSINDSTSPAVRLTECTVGYGTTEPVLERISFDIPRGGVTAIIGPNGSGKTTLIKTILGLVPLRSGTISLFGGSIDKVRDLISYVPQRFDFDPSFPITVSEFMELARRPYCPASRIPDTLREVGLVEQAFDAHLGSLSGGQLQRVLIAQAILNEPQLLVLDEPATGIDIVGEAAFYDIISHLNRDHGTTIVLVSHDISVVSSTVDTVVCVNKKLMCAGPPHIALSEKTLMEVFGKHASTYDHDRHAPIPPGHPHHH